MIKVGDFVKHKKEKICGTVMSIYPVCEGSENFLAEINIFRRELCNVKNLEVVDTSSFRWRKQK